ncbi:MAG: hypothetical protein U0324_15125 [Polyangiales bacterium]
MATAASALVSICLLAPACGSRTPLAVPDDAAPAPRDAGSDCARATRVDSVDLLFMVDNSVSMAENQEHLVGEFGPLIDVLVAPPPDPTTGARRPPVRSVHVGVVSSDLGTPGSVVPSCAATDTGDDGLLNPVRNGPAQRMHEPWVGAARGRPSHCVDDPEAYPAFLTFDADGSDAAAFRDDFVCNAYLSTGGCGLEQQLESAYRALVVHNPRAQPGNTDPNAGFVRDDAVLGIVVLTDEEDGSTRDCRYAENGVPCADATSVFDIMSTQWAGGDLNLRFYLYAPGSPQDPTWPIDRYIDRHHPARGFTSLKPGHPERVVFAAIAGVPLDLPTRGERVDWDALLGRSSDGADGYVGESAEGPVSMRPRNLDPGCPTRVVPACRREGTRPGASCRQSAQYFAQPSRRVAQVARAFDEAYGNGTVSSICRNDYAPALRGLVSRIQSQLCE